MTANRQATRLVIYHALEGHVPTAQKIYSYQPHSMNGESPVVFLTSSGVMRRRLTSKGYTTIFYINVHVVVFYGSEPASTYDDINAENILDSIEVEIAEALLPLYNQPNMLKCSMDNRSSADEPLIEGGMLYLHEIIPLACEVAA